MKPVESTSDVVQKFKAEGSQNRVGLGTSMSAVVSIVGRCCLFRLCWTRLIPGCEWGQDMPRGLWVGRARSTDGTLLIIRFGERSCSELVSDIACRETGSFTLRIGTRTRDVPRPVCQPFVHRTST